MPIYEYECPNGHRFERFGHVSKKNRTARCTCGAVGRKVVSLPGHPIADIPEHYNHSFGQVVRGRKQFRALQRREGTTDFEPSNDMRERLKESERKVAIAHGE